MSWFDTNRSIVRVALLALLVVSLLGPWMYDVIMVPAEYPCGKPTVRLEGDFCGYPMSGFEFFKWFAGGFFYIVLELIAGTFAGRARELISGLSLLLLLPFFSTLLLMWKKDSRRLQIVNLVAWALALIPTLTIFILQITDQVFRLWGLSLYVLVAIGALTVELLIRKGEGKTADGT